MVSYEPLWQTMKNKEISTYTLIEKYDIETQEELADRLREEGFQVTQATISRDIRELKLSKMSAEDGVQKYIVLEQNGGELENRYVRVLQEAYSSVDTAQNLVVIRTVSGMAMAGAAALDAMKLPEIVGCIAGDDTIFVAVHTQEETRLLREKVRMIVAREVHSEE